MLPALADSIDALLEAAQDDGVDTGRRLRHAQARRNFPVADAAPSDVAEGNAAAYGRVVLSDLMTAQRGLADQNELLEGECFCKLRGN